MDFANPFLQRGKLPPITVPALGADGGEGVLEHEFIADTAGFSWRAGERPIIAGMLFTDLIHVQKLIRSQKFSKGISS